MTRPGRRRIRGGAAARRHAMLFGLCVLAVPATGRAQERVRDVEFTAGLSIEGYRGNLTAATVAARSR